MSKNVQEILDAVVFNPKARASVNYAMAREAIERHLPNREEKRRAKWIVIEAFQGKVHPGKILHREQLPPFVQFPDTSRARV